MGVNWLLEMKMGTAYEKGCFNSNTMLQIGKNS